MEDRNIIIAMILIAVLALSSLVSNPSGEVINIVREAFACLAGLATGMALKEKE